MERVTETLASFLAETRFGDLPAEAISHAKRCILDFLGVCIGGSAMRHSRILAEFVRDMGGAQQATVIGYPFKAPCPCAGLVNGAAGHALQMDDTEWASAAHLGAAVVPAALAIAEEQRADGEELIGATVLGYEGAISIGAAINPSHNSRGFHPTGTLGVFGAAISAAKILCLRTEQMADAIGSAASQSSGLEEFGYDGSMSSILNSGHAAQAGLVSALLAQRGFTGSHTILEGRRGFCRAYSDTCNPSDIVARLGERYRILDVWFKQYPTCAHANSALDVILDLVGTHGIEASDVGEVRIKTYAEVEKDINNPHPASITAAMLSLQYSTAVAIMQKRVTPREFTEDTLGDENVERLMSKVKIIVADQELNEFAVMGRGAIVEIICRDGTRYEGRASAPRGHPTNPLSEEELLRKFETLASPILDGAKVNGVAEMVKNLEQVDDIGSLTRLLCP